MNKVDQRIFVRKGSSIPKDHVLTPGGFRHRSMAHFVKKGQRIRRQLNVLNVMAENTDQPVASHGIASEDLPIPDLGSGWITYTSWTNDTGKPIATFSTQWAVPPVPQTASGQTIFLFNSIEDAPQDDIVQPVLQWGVSAAGGGDYWAIANWYVDHTGHAFYSTLQRVNQGDTLTGIVRLTSQTGNQFSYVSSFDGHPDLDLPVDGISELVWATETLEAYQISQCSDYPNSPDTAMSSISITNSDSAPVLAWQVSNQVTDCNQSSIIVNAANPGGQVNINY
jgi:hypothetical protein